MTKRKALFRASPPGPCPGNPATWVPVRPAGGTRTLSGHEVATMVRVIGTLRPADTVPTTQAAVA